MRIYYLSRWKREIYLNVINIVSIDVSILFFFCKKSKDGKTERCLRSNCQFFFCCSHKIKGGAFSNMCASSSTSWKWITSGSAMSIKKGKGWVHLRMDNELLGKDSSQVRFWFLACPIFLEYISTIHERDTPSLRCRVLIQLSHVLLQKYMYMANGVRTLEELTVA